MAEIDLTTPTRVFDVTTKSGGYMGPVVRVNANNSKDAEDRVRKAGYEPNEHFPPEERTK